MQALLGLKARNWSNFLLFKVYYCETSSSTNFYSIWIFGPSVAGY